MLALIAEIRALLGRRELTRDVFERKIAGLLTAAEGAATDPDRAIEELRLRLVEAEASAGKEIRALREELGRKAAGPDRAARELGPAGPADGGGRWTMGACAKCGATAGMLLNGTCAPGNGCTVPV